MLVLSAVALLLTQASSAQEIDSFTGLKMSEGWLQVQATCTECHSARLISQNSGSREVWKSRLRWMQDTQGLGQLTINLEDTILDYLASNYGQKPASRRAGLPDQLMPDNPYENAQ
ncbi:MAG: hypothetical protein IIC59_11575 [Proteobacteria bacterium]|nr:hypothetical protein [Pseudomonadota bacterium]MCH8175808.1 hypothetical protein [Pseudomonadota bacterium]